MQSTWVVTANASKAKIYVITDKNNIAPISEFDNPEARLKEHEFVTDKPGHYKAQNPARSSFVGGDPKENEIHLFAKKITDFLKHEHSNNRFTKLILIASPHFLGHLKSNLDKHLMVLTKLSLAKDFTCITGKELLLILHEQHRSALNSLATA